jgi:hypothetical protein
MVGDSDLGLLCYVEPVRRRIEASAYGRLTRLAYGRFPDAGERVLAMLGAGTSAFVLLLLVRQTNTLLAGPPFSLMLDHDERGFEGSTVFGSSKEVGQRRGASGPVTGLRYCIRVSRIGKELLPRRHLSYSDQAEG